jgi:hypothetical protein
MSAPARLVAVAASIVLVLLTSGAADPGVRPGTAEGAELVKTGWWWVANDTPLDTTVAAPPQPAPPNVPKGTLPVSSAAGDPEKFSAMEFKLAGKPGGLVEQAVLVLRENTSPGATTNAEGAKIVACPVAESFWADGASGAWRARPTYDCDVASAPGERDAKTGLWTFDLTSVASLWAAADHTGSTSAALVEAADAPESFQVAFDGPSLEGVGFRFSIGAPLPTADLPVSSSGSAGSGAATSGGMAAGSSGSVGGGSAPAPVAGAPDVAPAGVPAQEPAVAAPAAAETTPVASPIAAPPWYAGIPAGGYVVLLLALGLAYLMMLALGPDAQPAAGPTQRGVSRALERLRNAAVATTTKVRR